MIKKLSLLTRNIFFYCCILISSLLIISNLAPFLNPRIGWMISLLGLIFPLLLGLTILFLIIWIFINPKTCIFFLAAILISIPSILNTFAINNSPPFNYNKTQGSIRIVTWNVGLLNLTAKDHLTAETENARIFNKLKELDADVICLQEFFTAVTAGAEYNFMDSLSNILGYRYHYFSKDISYYDNQFYSGNIIYSKYKITDSSQYIFPDSNAGALLKIGLLINNDTTHIFTTRLQSVNFKNYELQTIKNIKNISDPKFNGSANIIRKLKFAFQQRSSQTNILTSKLNETKGPVIFTGDLNDVPSSYTYYQTKKNMKDVWLKKGFGIGRTFRYLSSTLRIDYILINRYFKTLQTQRIISTGSDHYGLVTDIVLKKEVE